MKPLTYERHPLAIAADSGDGLLWERIASALMAFDTEWDEGKHKRGGNPENAGQFSSQGGAGGGAAKKAKATPQIPPLSGMSPLGMKPPARPVERLNLENPKPLDHGELSIPNRTKNINRELDRHNREQAAAQKVRAKEKAAETRDAKTRAKSLFAEHASAMAASTAEKSKGEFTAKQVLKHLDQLAKWQPQYFIDLVQRSQKQNAAAPKASSEGTKAAGKKPATLKTAAPKKPKTEKAPVDVGAHAKALKGAMGNEQSFRPAFEAIRKLPKADLLAIANQLFEGTKIPKSATKQRIFESIEGPHKAVSTFEKKLKAIGGRSAA